MWSLRFCDATGRCLSELSDMRSWAGWVRRVGCCNNTAQRHANVGDAGAVAANTHRQVRLTVCINAVAQVFGAGHGDEAVATELSEDCLGLGLLCDMTASC